MMPSAHVGPITPLTMFVVLLNLFKTQSLLSVGRVLNTVNYFCPVFKKHIYTIITVFDIHSLLTGVSTTISEICEEGLLGSEGYRASVDSRGGTLGRTGSVLGMLGYRRGELS